MKSKLMISVFLAAVWPAGARASVLVSSQTLGDTTYENVHIGTDTGFRLHEIINDHVPPITRPDTSPLTVGDVDLGQNPATSDQLQIQRWFVTGGVAHLKLTYLGQKTAYSSPLKIYTYGAGQTVNDAAIGATLFTTNVTAAGTQILFDIPDQTYFGFVLEANGPNPPDTMYWTENVRNSDNAPGRTTDHFLMFNTNFGLMVTAEDLAYDSNPSFPGLLGDQDYNDVLVGFITFADDTPIPEPSSLFMLGLAAAPILTTRRRRRNVIR